MRLFLVPHAMVDAAAGGHPALWPLSDAGRAAVRRLAGERLWRPIDRIYTSPELKAHETAQILAGYNGIGVSVIEDLREVERDAPRWIDDHYPGGYAGAVQEYLARPERATHGWEPPRVAQARIRSCVEMLRGWESRPFAIVGHGLILNLYLAAIAGTDPAVTWPQTTRPDLAVVEPERGVVLHPFGRWAGERAAEGDRVG